MVRSHTLSSRATRSRRAPIGAQPIAEDAAASSPRTSEGPVPPWAPEASPSDSSPIAPTAHISQEPEGSPPSRRSFRPLRWADPADARAWLDQVRASFADLAAVAREGSHRRKRRVLSRAEIRSQRRAAERSLLALLAAADAGLTRPSPEAGERGA
jgi:hypothetical protein